MDAIVKKLIEYGADPAVASLAAVCSRMAQDLVALEQQAQQATQPSAWTPQHDQEDEQMEEYGRQRLEQNARLKRLAEESLAREAAEPEDAAETSPSPATGILREGGHSDHTASLSV